MSAVFRSLNKALIGILAFCMWLAPANAQRANSDDFLQSLPPRVLFTDKSDGPGVTVDVFWCTGTMSEALASATLSTDLAASYLTLSMFTALTVKLGTIRTRQIEPSEFLRKVGDANIEGAQRGPLVIFDNESAGARQFVERVIDKERRSAIHWTATGETVTPNYVAVYVCGKADLYAPFGRVYIQVNDEKQIREAESIRTKISKRFPGISVGGDIEVVGSRSPDRSELRYFFPADEDVARALALEIAQDSRTDLAPKLVPGYEKKIRRGTMEIWIASRDAGIGVNALREKGVIKVGILHSLSGTMAISETTLKDVMLMLIDEQNKKGGVLGRKLEAVVVDPASNWPLFAERARELLQKDKVAVVFGCWTSVSRKAVLPVFEELNGLLFYPVQYEGEESSRNVFYTGGTPNQQAIPAVDYLMNNEKVQRWVLAGTDYVYPRTTNKILEGYLMAKGVKREDIMINYTPFGHSDWQSIVADIKKYGSVGIKTAVVSTINGDANIPFYMELRNQGISTKNIPVVALSVGEEELAGIDAKPLAGTLAASNYFQSVKNPANEVFIKTWQEFTKNSKRVTNDPMEAHYIGFNMWVEAVEKAGTTNPDAVIDAMIGVKVPNLTGGVPEMLPSHHITKPALLGEILPNGQFETVWHTTSLLDPQVWSPYLADSKNLVSDWRKPINCGNYNVVSRTCLGKGK